MTQGKDTTVDALVVGAGPTGLTAAAELARRGMRPRVVDRAKGPADTSRAIAVSVRTMEVFELLGIVEPLIEAGLSVKGADMWTNGEHAATLDLAAGHTPYPYGLDVPQCDTERILRDHLAGLGVEIEWDTELVVFAQDGDGVTATVRSPAGEETVRAHWLVGADGKESTVRKGLGIAFEGESMPELWALLEARLDWDLTSERRQIFASREGTWQAYPLAGGTWRLMCDVGDVPEDTRLPLPTAADFERRARERGVPLRGVHDGTWSSYFRISERVAAQYRRGRAFVAGDAAHIHSPAAGQGMNTGIQDAHNLAWKIALAEAAGADAAEALLGSYERERRPVAKQVLRRSGNILRSQTMDFAGVDRLRKTAIPFVRRIPHLAARMNDGLAQVDIDYADSPIVGDGGGRRAINVVGLTRHGGEPGRIYDALRGTGYTVLLFGSANDLGLLADAADARGVDTWWVVPAGAEPRADAAERTLFDSGGEALREYGIHGPSAVLVRPDGYVAWRGSADVPALERTLDAALPATSQV